MYTSIFLTTLLAAAAVADTGISARHPAQPFAALVRRQTTCPDGTKTCGATCIPTSDVCCPPAPVGEVYSCSPAKPVCSPDDQGLPGCCASEPCEGPGGLPGTTPTEPSPSASVPAVTESPVYPSSSAYVPLPTGTGYPVINGTNQTIVPYIPGAGAAAYAQVPQAVGVMAVAGFLAALAL
ncbi:MAG: hypothetical protein M1833_004215 [Piccolia ochrophora]|nr:MAG: hypothetical protein M1833_004215 [Piccolia ochrophora]